MNTHLPAGMAEATRLTQTGKLREATALIQRTLRGALTPDLRDEPSGQPADEIIEGSFQVVEPAAPLSLAALPPPARNSHEHPRSQQPAHTALPARSIARSTRPAQAKPDATTSPNEGLGRGRNRIAVGTGGQFVSGLYTNQTGTRSYKLYVPSGYTG